MIRRPPRSTLFPYTTLFRSRLDLQPRALIAKEVRTLARDVAQWSQLFLMAALMFIYLYNIRMLPLGGDSRRSEEHTSELQSQSNLVCRLLLEKKNTSTAVSEFLAIAFHTRKTYSATTFAFPSRSSIEMLIMHHRR